MPPLPGCDVNGPFYVQALDHNEFSVWLLHITELFNLPIILAIEEEKNKFDVP